MSSKKQIEYITDKPDEILDALKELDRAEELHPEWPIDDIYKCLAVFQEEVGELTQAILDFDTGKGSVNNVIIEANHAAAMGLRFRKNICMVLSKLTEKNFKKHIEEAKKV